MNLYKHQQDFIDKNPDTHLLAWDTGTGKTLAALEWAKKNPGNTLIVVPKALKESWKHYIADYDIEHTIITKEEFRKNFEKLPRHRKLIIDEAHYFAGLKSKMSKNMALYCRKHNVRFRLLLTATPYLSTPWNIFMLAKHLGYSVNWYDFSRKYFNEVRMGTRIVPMPKKGVEKDMARIVKQIGTTIRLDECADVPDQVFVEEFFKQTASQKRARKTVVDILPIVRFTRYHQIEQGTLKKSSADMQLGQNLIIKSDKNERLLELARDNKKIAIVARYNLQIDAIKSYLELNKLAKPIYVIRGDTSGQERHAIVQKADAEDVCVVIINAACSEGYELPSIGLIVFASLGFSYKDYKQVCGRFLRINTLKKNVYIHLITEGEGCVDPEVYKSIRKKEDFSVAIYAKGLEV